MPICSGAAEPKNGQPTTIVIEPAYVVGLLPLGYLWLRPFIGYIPPLVIDVATLCDAQPTDFPVLDAAELLGLVTRSKAALVTAAVAKITQIVHVLLWYVVCKCVGDTPDPAPTPQPAPSDLPALNPPGSVQLPGGTCASYVEVFPTGRQVFHPGEPNSNDANNAFSTVYYARGGPGVMGSYLGVQSVLPAGAKHLKVTFDNTFSNGTVESDMIWVLYFYSDTAIIGNSAVQTTPLGSATSLQMAVTTGATGFSVGAIGQTAGPTPNQKFVITADVYCTDVPGAPLTACCPPDANLLAKLDQLLSLVTLVQRQHVPFAYVPALEYPGLTGAGTVTFSDPIVRAQVELTTLPAHYGMAEGSPDAVFDVGWISLGTADGFERAKPISTTPYLLNLRGDHTRIGYSLSPGVVATIRTYFREP